MIKGTALMTIQHLLINFNNRTITSWGSPEVPLKEHEFLLVGINFQEIYEFVSSQ